MLPRWYSKIYQPLSPHKSMHGFKQFWESSVVHLRNLCNTKQQSRTNKLRMIDHKGKKGQLHLLHHLIF